MLNKIRFQQEIRSSEDITIPAGKSKPAEIKMAIQLINQLSTKFDISKYKDTYTDNLMKLIKAKSRGKQVAAAPLRIAHSRSRDLMEQLKESLGSGTTTKRKAKRA